MKKFFSMMMIAAAVFSLAACENGGDDEGKNPGGQGGGNKGKLATPELSETHTETSITVTWGAVENAEAYIVNLGGTTNTTEECTYTFENLNAGEYTIRVGAKAEGYEDSDLAKITVTLTGATSVDWFTQTVSLPAEENAEEGIYRCNTIDFTWKGTGVSDIRYGLYVAADLEGVSDKEIKESLSDLSEGAKILEEVNGDGFSASFTPVSGGTTYALCVEVTNAQGVKFFTRSEITTETAVASDAAKAWLGTWTATTTKEMSVQPNAKGDDIEATFTDKTNTFTLTITENPNDPNQVNIDGLSVLGVGYPTVGVVIDNQLNVMTSVYLGMNQGYYVYWLPFIILEGDYSTAQIVDFGQMPAYVLTMNEDGSVTGDTFKGEAQYQDGTKVGFEVVSSEVYGVSDKGGISFFVDAWPAVYRAGAIQVTKESGNVSAKTYSVKSSVLPVIPTNVTTAW